MLHAEWEERKLEPECSIGLRKNRITINTSFKTNNWTMSTVLTGQCS